MKTILSTSVLLLLLISGLQCQTLTKKEATKAGIKSVSVIESSVSDRKAKPIAESISRYDNEGNLLEVTERDNSGQVILHESYEYNADGLKTVEIQYETDGKIKKRHVYQYQDGLRSERLYYDKNGTLVSRKKYVYEYHTKS